MLYLGSKPEKINPLRETIGEIVEVRAAAGAEEMSGADKEWPDLVIIDLDEGEENARRITSYFSQSHERALLMILDGEPAVRRDFSSPWVFHQALSPLDPQFILGALRAFSFEENLLESSKREAERHRRVFELSLELLKISSYEEFVVILSSSLPMMLPAPFLLVSMPAMEEPIAFFQAESSLGPGFLAGLRKHLEDAWINLQGKDEADWDWVTRLPIDTKGDFQSTDIESQEFISAPISRGDSLYGFLTVYAPRWEEEELENVLTHLAVADMLSIVVQNLELVSELNRRATYDHLTGLLNREALMEHLDAELSRVERYGSPLCLVMMDIDHFKQVNDMFGHQTGDLVLKEFARVLHDSLRKPDYASRSGGEEFVAVLPMTDIQGGMRWAERFRSKLSSMHIKYKNREVQITSSFGVAACHDGTKELDRLLGEADAALYMAKRKGRNRVCCYDPNDPLCQTPDHGSVKQR